MLISIYFSKDISYVWKELEKKFNLEKFVEIRPVPDSTELSRFISHFSKKQFINLVLKILNTISQHKSVKKPG